jgi:hypothetical protein
MNGPVVPERCPSDLQLELVLFGDASAQAQHKVHLASCARCAHRLSWMREEGAHFLAQTLPATREAVHAALVPGRSWRLLWSIPALTAVAAALLLWPRAPPSAIQSKGASAPVFEVYHWDGSRARRLSPGATVHPGELLRFVATAPGRQVFVLTLDSGGQVSRLYPQQGSAPVPAEGELPGSAILDEVVGPERIFAVFAEAPLTLEQVESAARQALQEHGVRELERLPLSAEQETLLIEKVPR